jgi:HK97 family phage portal protein
MTTKPRTAKPRKPRKTRKPEALAPETVPPQHPGEHRLAWLVPQRTAGVRVNEDTALTLSAVWACVRVISESLAGLPWHVFRRQPNGGLQRQADHPVDWLLDVQANPETPAFQFRETLIAHALTWGNGYAEIERDFAGRPVWMWQITPDRVTPMRATEALLQAEPELRAAGVRVNDIVYRVDNELREPSYLPAADMFHLRGLGFDGLVGYSVVRMAARSIGIGISTEDDAGTLFANGSRPQAVLVHPKALSDKAKQNLEQSLLKQRKKGDTLILEEDIKYTSITIPPRDAQLIEQRQFTPAEICRWFRVQPHKIMDLSRSTFSNIEHQSIEFVNDTLRPWAERKESEADIKLFGRTNRGQLVTMLDLSELKRGDLAAQTAFAREMFDRAGFDVDELRQYFGLNPLGGEDGKKRFVPLNFVRLDKAGEPEETEPEPAEPTEPTGDTPPADDTGDDEERMSRVQDLVTNVLRDICQRLAGRTADVRNLEGDKRERWLTSFREEAHGRLIVACQLFAEVCGARNESAAAVALATFLDNHLCEPDADKLRHYIQAAAAATKELTCPQ